jgi:hypothetical protein
MKNKSHRLVPFLTSTLCAALLLGSLALAQAEDQKTDPTGTWGWTMKGRNGNPDRKMSLKLKLDGDKLTGKLITPGRNGRTSETEIKDAKVNAGEYSFTTTRERDGNTTVTKYVFKISGDTLKGKVTTERNGQARRERDWQAKLVQPDAAK